MSFADQIEIAIQEAYQKRILSTVRLTGEDGTEILIVVGLASDKALGNFVRALDETGKGETVYHEVVR